MSATHTPIHKHLRHLNAKQREVALHKSGPLLVLAGAGSGKTTTMAARISSLIGLYSVPGHQILGLSFTRKAAYELKTRVTKSVKAHFGDTRAKGIMLSTFHSLGVWLLRQKEQTDTGGARSFTILDESDQKGILAECARSIRFDDRKFDLDIIRFEISRAKNSAIPVHEFCEKGIATKKLSERYWDLGQILYEKYQERLRLMNAYDFDDLLLSPVEWLTKFPDAAKAMSERFKYILVDEYQDTNPTQFALLKALTTSHDNIVVVGDDDQAIYGWRGAKSDFILGFPNMFPGTKIVTLDQNYRSTQKILEAANAVIALNTKRHTKNLWSNKEGNEPITELICTHEREEADIVAKEIYSRTLPDNPNSKRFRDFAVLYRSNTQARLFEEALRRHQVPYKIVGGMSFLDRKEVKDVLAIFKTILNPSDDAACRRALAWPARGLGEKTLGDIRELALEANVDFIEALRLWTEKEKPTRTEKARIFLKVYDQKRTELKNLVIQDGSSLIEWGKSTLVEIGYLPALYDSIDDPVEHTQKKDLMDELCEALGEKSDDLEEDASPESRLQDFLSRLSVAPENEDSDRKKDDNKDQVTLLTLHGSKGLEFNTVFLVGCEEGFLPHQRTIDEGTDYSEERRLAYVGITRAQENLILTRATHRTKYGKKVPRTPSRFLLDIPKDLLLVQNESFDEAEVAKQASVEHEKKVVSFFANLRKQLEGDAGS